MSSTTVKSPTLEICCSSLESAVIADRHGADRIELCQNLEAGGITPSFGLLKAVMSKVTIPVHVLIRCRTGHFVYTDDEIAIMREDILNLQLLNPAGFVIGAMTEDRSIHFRHCQSLIAAAGEAQITFHRAFDDCAFPKDMLETVIKLGCSRLLTSGGGRTALDDLNVMRWLLEQSRGRIEVMAGAGVTPRNATKLLDLGVQAIHSSTKREIASPKWYRNVVFAKSQLQADGETVAALVRIVEKYRERDRPPPYTEKP